MSQISSEDTEDGLTSLAQTLQCDLAPHPARRNIRDTGVKKHWLCRDVQGMYICVGQVVIWKETSRLSQSIFCATVIVMADIWDV